MPYSAAQSCELIREEKVHARILDLCCVHVGELRGGHGKDFKVDTQR